MCMMVMTMFATMSAMTPVVKYADINGERLECGFKEDGVALVPRNLNEKFLKGVYCGSPQEMCEAGINITQWKATKDYTIALLKAMAPNIATTWYVVTYKPQGGIIDGALLLCEDDILIASGEIMFADRGIKMEAKSPGFSLEEHSVTVTRKFKSYVNIYDKGGPIITEDGSVTYQFDVDGNGIITRNAESPTFHSLWTEKMNMSIPGRISQNPNGDKAVTESNKCHTLGMGLMVIAHYTTPASDVMIADKTESRLRSLDEMSLTMHDSKMLEEINQKRKMLCSWQKGMMYRNPSLWLIWLDNHQDSKCMNVVKECLGTDEYFRAWMREAARALERNPAKNGTNVSGERAARPGVLTTVFVTIFHENVS